MDYNTIGKMTRFMDNASLGALWTAYPELDEYFRVVVLPSIKVENALKVFRFELSMTLDGSSRVMQLVKKYTRLDKNVPREGVFRVKSFASYIEWSSTNQPLVFSESRLRLLTVYDCVDCDGEPCTYNTWNWWNPIADPFKAEGFIGDIVGNPLNVENPTALPAEYKEEIGSSLSSLIDAVTHSTDSTLPPPRRLPHF
jgi:hypothetical protein